LINTPVPTAAQLPPLGAPANLHQLLASDVFVFDQYSTMVGVSHLLTPNSKVKFELMRTKVGLASALVDGAFRQNSFNVFTLVYNYAF